jgi:aryl-phospho-beta-D-glucosidase BglC (GH1 family)
MKQQGILNLLTLTLVHSVLSKPHLPRYTNSTGSGVVCNGTFSRISAQTWADGMNPGWNLGNTLDGIPDEGDWGNPRVVPSTLDDVKKAGFKGVRLPGKMLCSRNLQPSDNHSDVGVSLRYGGSRLYSQLSLASASV